VQSPLNFATNKSVSLDRFVQRWPTPTADAGLMAIPSPVMAERFHRKGSSGSFVEAMAGRMWPTPTSITDSGGAALCKWGGSRSREKLRTLVTPEELNGALNPTWVEWLMGFPTGWTDLER